MQSLQTSNTMTKQLPVVENWKPFASESTDARVQNMYSDFVAEIERLQAAFNTQTELLERKERRELEGSHEPTAQLIVSGPTQTATILPCQPGEGDRPKPPQVAGNDYWPSKVETLRQENDRLTDALGDQIYKLLVLRGYAQHEAHLIAGGPGCISDCVQKGEPDYDCPKHGALAQRTKP